MARSSNTKRGHWLERRLVAAALMRDPSYRAEKQEVARLERAGRREALAVKAAEAYAARLRARKPAGQAPTSDGAPGDPGARRA